MCRVIIVDDNPIDHLIIKKMLEQFDIFQDPTSSLNGEAVIAFLEECYDEPAVLPDLIFLDLNMPFSGREFLEHLALLYPSLYRQPEVYMLSSSIDPADMDFTKHYSFVKGFISKPISMEALLSIENKYQSQQRLAS